MIDTDIDTSVESSVFIKSVYMPHLRVGLLAEEIKKMPKIFWVILIHNRDFVCHNICTARVLCLGQMQPVAIRCWFHYHLIYKCQGKMGKFTHLLLRLKISGKTGGMWSVVT